MTASLIRKELHQHWWALLLIGLFSVLGIGWILLLTVIQSQAGSYLFALRLHATLLAFSALILGNRLVVAEYSARTQIFLESLPLPRARIVLVKYAIGLVVMLFCAVLGLGFAMLMGLRTEVYTLQFVGILTARYLCFTVFVYSFFFGMGFLGRYRFAAYALIVAGVALVIKTRDIQLHELAPIQLVGATFPFEREIYPVTDLMITGGLSLAFLLLAVVLASAREGSVSSLLGERMSYRDKISLTALIFGMLAAFFVIDERKAKDPYKMADGFTVGGARLSEVTVSPSTSVAGELADRLSRDLDEMAEFLGLTKLPPVFIIERPDLDPNQFEAGLLDDAEGIIIRTPFNHPEWRYAACLERVSGDVIESTSNHRAMKENRFWVIDGFSLYWPHRGDPEAPLDKDLHLILRALYGTEKVKLETPEDLHRWFRHQNAVGHQITAGIGWSMLRVLEQTAGPDAARAFMQSVLGTEAPRNLLVTLQDLQNPVEKRFRTSTGLELAAFMDTWNAELAKWRGDLAEPLAEIPRLEGELIFEKDPGGTSQARFRFIPPKGSSPETLRRPVLLYGETGPFRTGVSEVLRKRRPLSPDESSEGWLVETWGSGAGLAWTFAADQPQLRCRIISGWRHDHIP